MYRKRAYIISLNFNPGHVSHMVASYKQCEELGYEARMYIDKRFIGFIPENCRYIVYGQDKPVESTFSIFVFPSVRNLKEILWLKKNTSSKIIYIFHEPLDKYSTYRKAGFSHLKMLKLWVINMVNALTVKWSDIVLLPSEKAVSYYKSNSLYRNDNYHYLPLLYDDEQTEDLKCTERKYFSYIGTVASDHSFNEFVDFVRQAIQKDGLSGFRFLIATKSKVDHKVMSPLIESGRLDLYDGIPLTDRQINMFYASSYAVWNAYERTTQSGVLAKAFMFGTPVVFLEKNISEFVHDGQEGISVKDNTDYNAIKTAIVKIRDSFDYYSGMCRKRFLQSFYYQNYNGMMENLFQEAFGDVI